MLWLRIADGIKVARRRDVLRNTRPFRELSGVVGVKRKIKNRCRC
jgi:hypothetical protein